MANMNPFVVPEVPQVDHNNVCLAVGFVPHINENLDDPLPFCKCSIMTPNFGKLLTYGNLSAHVKIYKTNCNIINELQNVNFPNYMTIFQELFNEFDGVKLVVKVTPVNTYRILMTCFKEAKMTQRIFQTTRNSINGSCYVCKPYICSPIFLTSGWHFVFVSAYCKGITLSKLINPFNRLLYNVKYSKMKKTIINACDNLWKLGFVHNDLQPSNVIYNPKNNTITFIDLETTIEVETHVNNAYIQQRIKNKNTKCHIIFQKTMLDNALHLLRYSEKWLHEFTTKEHDSVRLLYNIDCNFMAQFED
jgi:serine/threonine protein kinase